MDNIEQMVSNLLPFIPELYEFTIYDIVRKAGDSTYANLRYPGLFQSIEEDNIPKIESYLVNGGFAIKKENGNLVLAEIGSKLKRNNSIENYRKNEKRKEDFQKIIKWGGISNIILTLILAFCSFYYSRKSYELSIKSYELQKEQKATK